jgi:hypothetical protein
MKVGNTYKTESGRQFIFTGNNKLDSELIDVMFIGYSTGNIKGSLPTNNYQKVKIKSINSTF